MNQVLLSGFRVVVFLLAGIVTEQGLVGQNVKTEVLAFYNLENLFDTIDTPGVDDMDFTPEGAKKWDSQKYWTKIDHLAKVISKLGAEYNSEGSAIIGLCEMENLEVLNDLVNADAIKHRSYQIIHYDSPDERGIDVALIYRPDVFKVESSSSVPLLIKDEQGEVVLTRDQLVVSGLLDGERMHLIVNHWPSRYGGEKRSRSSRIEAARVTRAIVDSIVVTDRRAKIVVMGDLNDDPDNESVCKYLNAHADQDNLKLGELFNATGVLFAEGQGTLPYRDSWNLFDQIIISQPLLKAKKGVYAFDSVHIFKPEFLLQPEGRYKGYTWRTYVGNNYHGGFSDHLPAYIILKKK